MPRGRHAKTTRTPLVLALATAVVLASGVAAAATRSGETASRPASIVFDDRFSGPDGLITNEVAFERPGAGAPVSPLWQVTSGSLFRRNGTAWSGVPDTRAPGPTGAGGTNSDVFRMVTKRQDFGDVRVHVQFEVVRFDNSGTVDSFDGFHVFVRYGSPQSLLVVSVCRRDDVATVKKKVPGGTTNGGTYFTLASAGHHCATGQWHDADITTATVGGTVHVDVSVDGSHLLSAIDTGQGGPPLAQPGRVGIRADNVEFLIRRFWVSRL